MKGKKTAAYWIGNIFGIIIAACALCVVTAAVLAGTIRVLRWLW